jgi:DNA-binding NarL/FixJ family response regulator
VVVADDHSRIREAIEIVLSSSFDVVAAVADGHHAVEAALELDADVVVLDITMPRLDGFGAARELVRRGARAKILCLTVHASDEYVAAAVEAGIQGYVVKSRLTTDLVDAVGHVLAGRLRVPALSSLLGIADPRARCSAQFYTDDETRLDDIHRLAARALRRGDVVAVIGAPAMRGGVAARLTNAGFDLTSLSERGRYQTFDAEDALRQVMRGDEPDASSLADFAQTLEQTRVTSAHGDPKGLVVLGELATLLLRNGNTDGALAIERIWHGNAVASRFHTVCSYGRTSVEAGGRGEVLDQLSTVHHAVSP